MGGAEYQLKCLLDKLAFHRQFEIFYLAKSFHPSFQPNGYKVLSIGNSKGMLSQLFFLDVWNLLKLLRRVRPDVILQRHACAYTGIATYYAIKNRCDMIFHVSSDNDILDLTKKKNILNRIDRKFIDYGLRFSPRIVTQTHQQASFLEGYYRRKPAAVIPNFHPLPSENIRKKEPVKIVWVANFKPLKQPECFIRLSKELEKLNGNVQCIMIGAPLKNVPDRQLRLEKQIESIKNLVYLGALPIDQVNSILAEAHIFVNTSLYEGFPNTFIQAWMRKVPVVSLHCDPDGIIQRYKLGCLAGTFQSLVQKVIYLIDNSLIREKMGKTAQRYAYQKHNIHRVEMMIEMLRNPSLSGSQ